MMKRRGVTLSDIADELHVDVNQVNNLINQRFKQEAAEHTAESRQMILMMEDDRLEFYLSKLWPEIEMGDPKAIAQALGVHDRKAKLHRIHEEDASTNQAQVLIISGAEKSYVDKLKEITGG